MGSPVSPIVAKLHKEEVESEALGSSKGQSLTTGTATWMIPGSKSKPVEAFTVHPKDKTP